MLKSNSLNWCNLWFEINTNYVFVVRLANDLFRLFYRCNACGANANAALAECAG